MTLTEAAKEIIDNEIKVVNEVTNSIKEQLTSAYQKLNIEQERARDLTSELVAAYNIEDKQLLASDEAVAHALSQKKSTDIKALQELQGNPYFARIVVEEIVRNRKVTREYRLGTHANPDCRIIDWRHAPIAKLFYEYQEGDEFFEEIQGVEREGKIVLRVGTFFNDGKLVQINSSQGNFVLTDSGWEVSESAKGSSRSSYGSLPSILSLISQEQFSAITEDSTEAVLIEGVAGSGKTTVALYRLSWLLHQENSDLQQHEAAIVVKSSVLKSYIQKSLHALDLPIVKVQTFQDWLLDETLPVGATDLDSNNTKMAIDHDLALELNTCLNSSKFIQTLELVEFEELEYWVKELKEKIDFEALPDGLVKLASQSAHSAQSIEQFCSVLRQSAQSFVAEARSENKYTQSVTQLVKLIDQKMSLLPSDLERIIRTINRLGRAELIPALNFTDDNLVELLLRTSLAYLNQIKGCFKPKSQLKHLVVDEAQDLTPLEFAALIGCVNSVKNITVVGDRAQKINHPELESSYDLLNTSWGKIRGLNNIIDLEVSYRCSKAIMDLASYVTNRKLPQEKSSSMLPKLFKCYSEDSAFETTRNWIDAEMSAAPGSTVAIVCANIESRRLLASFLKPHFGNALHQLSESNSDFDNGVIVTDISTIKGLEFHKILIWDLSRDSFPENKFYQNLLYVGITRAEAELALVCWSQTSKLLPPVNDNLLDFYLIEKPEEDEIPDYELKV